MGREAFLLCLTISENRGRRTNLGGLPSRSSFRGPPNRLFSISRPLEHRGTNVAHPRGGIAMTGRILGTCSSVAIMAGLALLPVPAAAQTPSALAGKVTSQDEGAMEGVLVNAKRAGSTMTI